MSAKVVVPIPEGKLSPARGEANSPRKDVKFQTIHHRADGPNIQCREPLPCQASLKLEWAFGLHKDFKSVVHNLSVSSSPSSTCDSADESHGSTAPAQICRKVFYVIAHVGVIYDATHNTQIHLMGHMYTIVATCCSHNRRFIVTADEGDRNRWKARNLAHTLQTTDNLAETAAREADLIRDPSEACIDDEDDGSVMIVWDTATGLPVKTIPVGKYGGVMCCSMSLDGLYIATINRRTPQEVMIWGWTVEGTGETPEQIHARAAMVETQVPLSDDGADLTPEFVRRIPSQDEQTCIRFSFDDPQMLCTNGQRRVMFWSWSEGMLKYYSPPILQKDLNTPVGNFTQTVLIPSTTLACSGTVDGDVVLWELQPKDRVIKNQDKNLLKVVRVHTGGVTFVTASHGYIVTGGMDGRVKFLDTKLRVVSWFEDLNGGPVISVSFDRSQASVVEHTSISQARTRRNVALQGTVAPAQFTSPDFMVSTANSMIIDVAAKAFHTADRELLSGRLIVQGQDKALQCLAAHPKLSRLAIAGLSGSLHLWDYQQKRILILSLFRNLLVQSMAFDPSGTFLVVGFTNGVLKLLNAETLVVKQSFKPKRPDSILKICFSEDGRMMATGDAGGCVGLYEYVHRNHNPSKPMEWEFVGRHKAHRAVISGLQFGHRSNGQAVRLLSVGEDKRLVEYDLIESDVESGLLLRTVHKITQGAVPTGFLWGMEEALLDDISKPRGQEAGKHSGATTADKGQANKFDYLLMATNECKIGVYLSDHSRQCVKTVLAPTFGGTVTDMAVVPKHAGAMEKCLVYATREKVIGLVRLPLQGNPCASMGLLAHPGAILSTVVSHDGAYVFTAGGEDQSVMQWKINGSTIMPPEELAAVEAAPSGVPLNHLLGTVQGGPEGELMKEIVDYFYYAQIRAQGEETTAKRELLGAIHFSQMPNLLRALGYYPSELEIGHLTYEVANMYGPPGVPLDEVDVDSILLDFSQFMRLYINYCPVFGVTRQDIEAAFLALGADPATGQISRDAFFQILSSRGEPLRNAEIATALTSLLGEGVRVDMLEDFITAKTFAENLLGFEDYSQQGSEVAPGEEGDENTDRDDIDVDALGDW